MALTMAMAELLEVSCNVVEDDSTRNPCDVTEVLEAGSRVELEGRGGIRPIQK